MQPHNTMNSRPNGISFAARVVGVTTRVLVKSWKLAEHLYAQALHRREIEHMLDLDDDVLADIGVTRADIHRAINAPLDASAGCLLENVRRQSSRDALRP